MKLDPLVALTALVLGLALALHRCPEHACPAQRVEIHTHHAASSTGGGAATTQTVEAPTYVIPSGPSLYLGPASPSGTELRFGSGVTSWCEDHATLDGCSR